VCFYGYGSVILCGYAECAEEYNGSIVLVGDRNKLSCHEGDKKHGCSSGGTSGKVDFLELQQVSMALTYLTSPMYCR
jgi:hypothetical protein